MSVVIKGQTYHMISYYKESDVLDNKLSTPSEVKSLKKVVISDELLHQLKQPTQKAPGIEEIKKMNNFGIISNVNNSSLNSSNKEAINKSNEIEKQPYINISASVDNTININEHIKTNLNINNNKEDNLKINSQKQETKGVNIEEMITQIDDNMHFLQISQNNPQLLNHLHMNPELLHHVTQILNEKTNNANNFNINNNQETSNILHHNINNIKNNINPVTTTDHSLLNNIAISTSHPTLSILNNQTHDNTISNLHYSNIVSQYFMSFQIIIIKIY